jgi:hypothetical protein
VNGGKSSVTQNVGIILLQAAEIAAAAEKISYFQLKIAGGATFLPKLM